MRLYRTPLLNSLMLLCLTLVAACAGSNTSSLPTAPSIATVAPTFLPLPTATIAAIDRRDVVLLTNPEIRTSVSIYQQRTGQTQNSTTRESPFLRRAAGYTFYHYLLGQEIYVAIAIPREFRAVSYTIYQILTPSYNTIDNSNVSAIYRDLPEELSPFGEPETEGDACNQDMVGRMTITSMRPLQGHFQFNCQFDDGTWAAVSGVFSQ